MILAWMQWPSPSSTLRISTGQTSGVYYSNAIKYKEKLAHYGVTLEVLPSAGSAQNLERLRDAQGSADLAFVQGGFGFLGNELDNQLGVSVQTLANVDIEPVWIFASKNIDSLSQLRGQRVSLGLQGSGSRYVALALLDQVRLRSQDVSVSELSGIEAADALEKGQLDAMIFVSAPQAPAVRALITSPNIHLVQLKRNAALAEHLPYLEPQLLPQGKFDASGKYPPQDVTLLTTSASLLTRSSLAPALQRLATQAAKEVHKSAGILNHAGEFPSLRQIDFATAAQTRDVLANGLSWLESTFPFWWAQWITRVLLICIPFALLAWWLGRVVPVYLLWKLQAQVNRWYGELKYIEHDLSSVKTNSLNLAGLTARLQLMNRELTDFNAPVELMPRYYTLRQHFDFVFSNLQKMRGR